MKRATAHELLGPEVDRRLGDVGRRLDAASARAGVVIAAALVIVAIPAEATWARWVPVAFALSACALSGMVMLFRDSPEVPLTGLLLKREEHTKATLSAEIFDHKLAMLLGEEVVMTRRARQLSIAYIALALSAASMVLNQSIMFEGGPNA